MNEQPDPFEAVYGLVTPFSKCSKARLRNTWDALRHVDHVGITGAFVECGVWRGGSVMVARFASPHRKCWLFDTFEGMTPPGPQDAKMNGNKPTHKSEWMACSAGEVRDNLDAVGVYDADLCRFVKGDVCDTLPELMVANELPERIAVLRLDTDFYASTKAELYHLYPRLAVGGILIIDDYGHWDGARKAVREYLGKKARHLKPVDYTGAWMVKA